MNTKSAATQLEFVWKDGVTLQDELEAFTGLPIALTLTDNSSTVMSVRHPRNGGPVLLRLHRMFLGANPEVVRALAIWVKQPRRKSSGDILNRFIRENCHTLRRRPARNRALVSQGACFDLQELYDEVNLAHFEGRVTARIGWGRRATTRRRRSMRFGSYCAHEKLIRIHPSLDQPFVPRYFVRYIVFHEMLHADLGIGETPSGRRRIHTSTFRRREEAYPDYEQALAWQDKPANLRRLLR